MKSKTLPAWARLVCTAAAALVFLLVYEWAVYGVPLGRIYLPASAWSDEVYYAKQLSAVVTHGVPQGYFGFNESHAEIGRFAAWGPAVFYLYAIPGLIFRGQNAFLYCNLFWVLAGWLCFVWGTRLDWKRQLLFGVGIAALMAECGAGRQPVTAGTIGYTLAPRINAAGRMGQVNVATELFLTHDAMRAAELAQQLCRLNRHRQEVESEIYQDAVAMLSHGKAPSAIVLSDEKWHQGVVGIVASRLAEEYSCPAFLICLDGDKGKASSRSYGGFNLFGALQALSPLLESYGGHELAAGFTIRRDQIAPFRAEICRRAEEFFRSDACSTALHVDCEIPPQLLTLRNVEALDELEPCGAGCPRPVLCMRGLTISELNEVGGGKHLRLRLSRGRDSFQAIFFSSTAQRAAVGRGDLVEIAFTPQINEFRGIRSVQLNLVDIRPDEGFRLRAREQAALYAHHAAGEALCPDDAAAMLPERQDFVDLWRYLSANCVRSSLTEELGCLSRKIARATGRPCEPVRLRVCLDVLAEQRLIVFEQHPKSVHITLCPNGRKVDLTQSGILIHLKEQKAGK